MITLRVLLTVVCVYMFTDLEWQRQEEQIVHLLLLLHKLLLLRGERQGEDVDRGRRVPDSVNY